MEDLIELLNQEIEIEEIDVGIGPYEYGEGSYVDVRKVDSIMSGEYMIDAPVDLFTDVGIPINISGMISEISWSAFLVKVEKPKKSKDYVITYEVESDD